MITDKQITNKPTQACTCTLDSKYSQQLRNGSVGHGSTRIRTRTWIVASWVTSILSDPFPVVIGLTAGFDTMRCNQFAIINC